jgi:FkbM family methyltransferase
MHINTENIYTNQYGKYFVPNVQITDHYPDNVSNAIRKGDVYEHETIKYIIASSKGNSVVTAGTYFGDFIPALYPHFKTVYGFEPSQIYYDACMKTISLNNIQNAKIANKGLGECEEDLFYQEYQDNQPGAHRGGAARFLNKNATYNGNNAAKKYHENRSTLMKVTTLDLSIPENEIIDVLHIDVEGLEQQVLAGALNIINKNKPVIIIETNVDEDWFNKFLAPLKYFKADKVCHNICYRISV